MCAWSRPIAANLMWCGGATSGREVLASSTLPAPETPCAIAVADTPENLPAIPAACRKPRRLAPVLALPPSLQGQPRRSAGNGDTPHSHAALAREPPDGDGAEQRREAHQAGGGELHRDELEFGHAGGVHGELVDVELRPDRRLPVHGLRQGE